MALIPGKSEPWVLSKSGAFAANFVGRDASGHGLGGRRAHSDRSAGLERCMLEAGDELDPCDAFFR